MIDDLGECEYICVMEPCENDIGASDVNLNDKITIISFENGDYYFRKEFLWGWISKELFHIYFRNISEIREEKINLILE